MKEETEAVCKFFDLEKLHDKVNKEAVWQVLRIYDVGIKGYTVLRVYLFIVYPV